MVAIRDDSRCRCSVGLPLSDAAADPINPLPYHPCVRGCAYASGARTSQLLQTASCLHTQISAIGCDFASCENVAMTFFLFAGGETYLNKARHFESKGMRG